MTDAPKTYDDLDPEVQAFLSRLDEDDVHLLEASIDLSRRITHAASVARWCIITLAAVIVAVAALGDAGAKILRWFAGSPH